MRTTALLVVLVAGLALAAPARADEVDDDRLAAGAVMVAFGAPLLMSGAISVLGVVGTGVYFYATPQLPETQEALTPALAVGGFIAVAQVAIGSGLLYFGVDAIDESVGQVGESAAPVKPEAPILPPAPPRKREQKPSTWP